MLVEHVNKSYEIAVTYKLNLANLIVLDIIDYDVILGINWLATYHATVDYCLKVVKFDSLREPSFLVQGHRSLALYNLTSALVEGNC